MRRRISWLVVATTSVVVVSFVIPLCLLVRTLAEDRAMAAADQEARNVAILVSSLHDDPQLEGLVDDLDQRGAPTTSVLTTDGQVIGSDTGDAHRPRGTPRRAPARASRSSTTSGGRVLLPVVVESGTAVVRSSVTPDDLRRGVAAAWAGIIGLGVLLMALALLIAARLGKRVSEPVRQVAGVAHQLREGDLQARAERDRSRGDPGAGSGPQRAGRPHRATCSPRSGRRSATSPTGCGPRSRRCGSTPRRSTTRCWRRA